jgi:hypothetical protein
MSKTTNARLSNFDIYERLNITLPQMLQPVGTCKSAAVPPYAEMSNL